MRDLFSRKDALEIELNAIKGNMRSISSSTRLWGDMARQKEAVERDLAEVRRLLGVPSGAELAMA